MSAKRILLLGLDEKVAGELAAALTGRSHRVDTHPFLSTRECIELIEAFGADLVCCPAQPLQYGPLVKACQRNRKKVPVIVVTHQPKVSEWLDALESGASDYFGPPFEPGHVGWIVDSAAVSAPMASYVSVMH